MEKCLGPLNLVKSPVPAGIATQGSWVPPIIAGPTATGGLKGPTEIIPEKVFPPIPRGTVNRGSHHYKYPLSHQGKGIEFSPN